jgi:hypothetical protein
MSRPGIEPGRLRQGRSLQQRAIRTAYADAIRNLYRNRLKITIGDN